jgi:hypothetical protein
MSIKHRTGANGVSAALKLTGAAAMALSFIIMLGLAGCATNSGGSSLTANDSAAAQLAADLNAIKAGSATVQGATVKLAGTFVHLQSDLTVPAGVTLDVTADGAALGLGDVTLTVNGTVIAGPNHVRLEDIASAAVIKGSGTIRLNSKGRLLSVQGNKNDADRKITLDGVTLAGLKDNNAPLVAVDKGGEFVMKSGAITGNTIYTKEGWVNSGGVHVWGGTFTMEGGEISGNSAKSDGPKDNGGSGGGGVVVGESGVFTIKGGAISNNSAGTTGGGVLVMESGSFTMEGGAISGNTSGYGGGIIVGGGTFTMKGGAISGNTAENEGGGVRVYNNGTFTMEGGAISGNTAKSAGGVIVSQSAFILKGGRIEENHVQDLGEESAWFAVNLVVWKGTAKWGTGGVYTQGDVDYEKGGPRTGGSDIVNFNADGWGAVSGSLIAVPAK